MCRTALANICCPDLLLGGPRQVQAPPCLLPVSWPPSPGLTAPRVHLAASTLLGDSPADSLGRHRAQGRAGTQLAAGIQPQPGRPAGMSCLAGTGACGLHQGPKPLGIRHPTKPARAHPVVHRWSNSSRQSLQNRGREGGLRELLPPRHQRKERGCHTHTGSQGARSRSAKVPTPEV